ncbi:uncharacterized protein AB675_9732 [Cyphellophora attinorum]|uniref:Uncharacterized protein n=1 Tax=Cyphellophora attinorum TaxID=1664694 RepID=A0A0N1P0U7_9EURO|nr:uncharacterized protein AB675_9732 [Phialophora attinorum]KPI42630.1 hypothetical protein AB675_9732 [Phialophora attinorum]
MPLLIILLLVTALRSTLIQADCSTGLKVCGPSCINAGETCCESEGIFSVCSGVATDSMPITGTTITTATLTLTASLETVVDGPGQIAPSASPVDSSSAANTPEATSVWTIPPGTSSTDSSTSSIQSDIQSSTQRSSSKSTSQSSNTTPAHSTSASTTNSVMSDAAATSDTKTAADSQATHLTSGGLSVGTKAGIGVGAAVGIIALLLLSYCFGRRHRKGDRVDDVTEAAPSLPAYNEKAADIRSDMAELEGEAICEQWSELDSRTAQRYELDNEARSAEARAEASTR